jgi:phage FluMu protein Com
MTLPIQRIRCPNCKGVLEKMPIKNRRCPFCDQLIFIKTRRESYTRILMTEEEARQIDEEWRQIEEEQSLVIFAKQLGISREMLEIRKKELTESMGKPVMTRGAIWSLMNSKMIELIKNEDWHALSQLYFAQSLFLRKDGEKFFHVLQKSRTCSLKEYQARGITKVEILGNADSSCEICRALKGKVFSISKVMKMMPIPISKCENKGGYCRCVYSPVIE